MILITESKHLALTFLQSNMVEVVEMQESNTSRSENIKENIEWEPQFALLHMFGDKMFIIFSYN